MAVYSLLTIRWLSLWDKRYNLPAGNLRKLTEALTIFSGALMPLDEKLWVLDNSETFALSGWLTQAETIRREMNRLVFSHWDQAKEEQALSKSILRRYVRYWHTHRALVDREAIGVHGGTYAEELVASIVRARIQKDFGNDIQILQNHWDTVVKREADICALRHDKLLAVIEVKSALTKREWKKTRQTKEDHQKLSNPVWSKILSALKRLGFRSRNFLAQLVSETSRACTIRLRRSSLRRL